MLYPTHLILRQVHHRVWAIGIAASLRGRNKGSFLDGPLHIEAVVYLIHHIGVLAEKDNWRAESLLQRGIHIGELVRVGCVGGDACIGQRLLNRQYGIHGA